MLNKKLMILIAIAVSLLAISAVSAVENATSDVVGVEENQSIGQIDNNELSVSADAKTFTELQQEIWKAQDGETIRLDSDYIYNDDFRDGRTMGIGVDRASLTIEGNGHTIDGNGKSRIFYIGDNYQNIVLNNITFVNGYYNGMSGAIHCTASNLTITNCKFINNNANGVAGAVYAKKDNVVITNNQFINNSGTIGGALRIENLNGAVISENVFENNLASNMGGAIYITGSNSKLEKNQFSKNSATTSGGALRIEGANNQINGNTFEKNKCEGTLGGAILAIGESFTIKDNTFTENSAKTGGGAIYLQKDHATITNNKFNENEAGSGAAIRIENGNNATLTDNTFTKNNANNMGGAIYITGGNTNIQNNYFVENTAETGGGLYLEIGEVLISDCTFLNNEAYGSAIYALKCYKHALYSNTFNNDSIIFSGGSTDIYCDNITVRYGQPTTFSATLKNENISLVNKTIIFKLSNEKYCYNFTEVTNENGTAIIERLNDVNVGTYNVTVTFNGDFPYDSCNATATIIVLPINSSLTVRGVKTIWDIQTTFIAHVNSNNNSINEGTVSFYIGDEFIGNASILNGVATLTYDDLGDIGEFTIFAIFNSNNYLSSNNTAKLQVNKGYNDVLNYTSVGSFKALSKLIKNAPEGSTLTLYKDYIYISGSKDGISINKTIIIDGNGHTIDGNDKSKIFEITNSNVVLKNFVFTNCYSTYNTKTDGAIDWSGINGVLENCTFRNIAGNSMSALSSSGNNFTVTNCSFISNVLKEHSTLKILGDGSKVYNCTFVGNEGKYGGAIYWYGADGVLSDSYFRINSATNGGAINWAGNNGNIMRTEFLWCRADSYGGAIVSSSNNIVFSECIFYTDGYNGEVTKGNAIYFNGQNVKIINSEICLSDIYGVSEDSLINCTIFPEMGSPGYGYVNYSMAADIRNTIWEGEGYSPIEYYCEDMGVPINYYGNGIAIYFNKETNAMFYYTSDKTINSGVIVGWDDNYPMENFIIIPPGDGAWIVKNSSDSNLEDKQYFYLSYYNPGINVIKSESNLTCNITSFEYNNLNHPLSIILKSNDLSLINKTICVHLVNGNVSKTFNLTTTQNGSCLLNEELNNLYVGEWNVEIIFNGDTSYFPSNISTEITVLPAESSVTICDVNLIVNHESTLIANIISNNSTVNEGRVVFFDGSAQIGESPVSEGVATLNYVPTTAGEHSITTMYYGSNYEDSMNSALFNVSKAKVDLFDGHTYKIEFSMVRPFKISVFSNSNAVNEGTLKFFINNQLVGISDVVDGLSNYNYITNASGSFNMEVIFEETANYLASNISVPFDVDKMRTTLTAESVIFDEQDSKTFTTVLKDSFSDGVCNQTVKIEAIKYSGESATFNGISDENGITIYDVGKLAGGMWYVSGIYAGDENYIDSRFADKFIVVRIATTTVIEEIDNPKVNHTYKLKANIHDENGKLVKEGILQFYLDGVDIGSIDLSKNQGHQNALSKGLLGAVNPIFDYELGADDDSSDLYIEYIPTKAGKHTLTAVYEGTTIYKASNSTTTFVVTEDNVLDNNTNASTGNATDTNTTDNVTGENTTNVNTTNTTKPIPEIVIPPLDTPSSDGSVEISLPVDATGTVTLTINGKDYPFAIVNGKANVLIPNLGDGNYPYTITYSGDSKYSSFTNNGTLTKEAPKVDPVITASNAKVTYSAGSYYTIKVNGTDGKLADGVTVKITGKISKTLTTKNGVAKFKVTQLPGTYKITITALEKSVSKTIIVKHIVTLYTTTLKKSAKKITFKAKLAKVNGKVLQKKTITFKVNGKKVATAKTNAKGVAKIIINNPSVVKKLKVCKKVTYQATYLKDTVKKTTKIKK